MLGRHRLLFIQKLGVYGEQALAINPHERTAIEELVVAALNGRGDVKEARHLLDTAAAGNPLVPDIGHSVVGGLLGLRAYTCLLEHNTAAALNLFSDDNTAFDERLRRSARVMILLLTGDKAEAHAEAEKDVSLVEGKLRERPDDLDAIVQASWIYLGLERTDEAMAIAAHAAELLPPEKDAMVGSITLYNLAAIQCRSSKTNEAIEILRRLLLLPAGGHITTMSLRVDPLWDPIRNDSAFQQLLKMKERVGP